MQFPIPAGPVALRAWRRDDAEALVVEANSRAVWRNMSNSFPHPYTLEDAEQWVDGCIDQSPPRHLVIDNEEHLIGVCGIDPGEGVSRFTGEVGYWLGERHWGRGIASAAFAAFLGYVWERFPVERLQAGVFAWNPPSARVLEKNGFTLEGVHRKAIYKDGEFVDLLMFSQLRIEAQ